MQSTGRSIFLCVLFLLTAQTLSAQAPTISPNAGPTWLTRGNSAANSGNVLGPFFPSHLFVFTDSQPRMRINRNITTTVNGFSQSRDGFIGIGADTTNIWSTSNRGPFSLLHLNGDGPTVQELGFRPWMRTGITFTSNSDLAYVGHKTNALDVTDFVIAWADNGGPPSLFGPDVLKFVFTCGAGTGTNDLICDHPNGREILRMMPEGNVGIGPRFTNALPPRSQLHINAENNADAFFQMTVQSTTGQQATDGFRLGVLGASGDAWLNQQETANLFFSTDSTGLGNAGERMRISSVAVASTTNPGALPSDRTRVAISHSPASPVTHPLSLLHLGYNTQGANNDGWRPWMDVGTFTSHGSDHLYTGLKQELAPLGGTDRQDSVIAWGDNNNPSGIFSGPDFLRFIFTSSPGNSFDPAAQSANGREVMRLTPLGNVGIGNGIAVGARLDVDGDLRIRTLTQNNALTQVLVADPGDLNRVHWRDASTLTGASQFFQCNIPTAADKLPFNAWWELNDFNFIFSGQGGANNAVGIGTSCTPAAKLHVSRQLVAPAVPNATAIRAENADVSLTSAAIAFGVASSVTGANRLNVAGDFVASGATSNIGVRGTTTAATIGANTAGQFDSASANSNTGVAASAIGPAKSNVAVSGTASGGTVNFGGRFSVSGNSSNNFAVWAQALPPSGSTPPTGPNYAGFFDGDVFRTGTDNFTSDARLKRDVEPIAGSLEMIRALRPKTFSFDRAAHPRIALPAGRQYGLIAQDVEQVLPELVTSVVHPTLDGSTPEQYKTVNYSAFIAILIDAVQKQQSTIESLQAEVAALRARSR